MVARQFIAWNKFQSRIRPVGHGLILTHGCLLVRDRRTPIGPDHTVPCGTVLLLKTFQAINCLATISRSLRDKAPAGKNQNPLLAAGSFNSHIWITGLFGREAGNNQESPICF
jgi:hypothetical protein